MTKKIWSIKDDIVWANVLDEANKRKWNDSELARRTKTTPQHINKIRNHERGIGSEMLSRFVDAFGVDESVLLKEKIGLLKEKIDSSPIGITSENYLLCSSMLKDIFSSGAPGQITAIQDALKEVREKMDKEKKRKQKAK